jgi:hypothetical protein
MALHPMYGVGSRDVRILEAGSPGPLTRPPTLRPVGHPTTRKDWTSRGWTPPGAGLARFICLLLAHLLPLDGLGRRTHGFLLISGLAWRNGLLVRRLGTGARGCLGAWVCWGLPLRDVGGARSPVQLERKPKGGARTRIALDPYFSTAYESDRRCVQRNNLPGCSRWRKPCEYGDRSSGRLVSCAD